MTGRGISNTKTKTKSNPHYRYAMHLIQKLGYSIDIDASRYLYDILSKGTLTLNEQVGQVKNKPLKPRGRAGFSKGKETRATRRAKMMNLKYYKNIDRLISDIIKEKKELGSQKLIFNFDIENSLKKLCPLWPIC